MNKRGDDERGRVAVELEMTNYRDKVLAEDGIMAPERVRRLRVPGLVDTGASYLVLPKSLVHLG